MNDFGFAEHLTPALGMLDANAVDLADQVRHGFQHPLEFPEFNRFLFGGDRVAIAVHSRLSRVELVLDPLLDELLGDRPPGAKQVSLLFADRETSDRFAAAGKKRESPAHVVVQEGTQDGSLALLGSDEAGQPILVHRLVFDADVLIPVVRVAESSDSLSAPILLDFVDSATRRRWKAHILNGDSNYGERVCSLAGVSIVVQVAMGPGDFPYDVRIGCRAAAERALQAQAALEWQLRPIAESDILIASIDDRRDERSWQAVRDAIVAAAAVDGQLPIAVYSSVDESPPNELRHVFSSRSSRAGDPDSFDPELRRAISGRTIYLASHLPDHQTIALGMVPISGGIENRTWVAQWKRPALLRDLQRWRGQPLAERDAKIATAPQGRRRAPRGRKTPPKRGIR